MIIIIEEVVIKDKKVQEDIIKKSLSDGKSGGDIFVRKNSRYMLKIIV